MTITAKRQGVVQKVFSFDTIDLAEAFRLANEALGVKHQPKITVIDGHQYVSGWSGYELVARS